MPDEKKIVWVASDGTGRTALQAIKAALYQFGDVQIDLRVLGDMTTEDKVSDLVKRVKDEGGMIVYTIVSETRRRLLQRLAAENSIPSVDLFGPLIGTMEKFFRKVLPVIPGTPFPETVDKAGAKVFCLVIEAEILKKRRVDRIRRLGDPKVDGYTELSSIIHELSYCRQLAEEGKKWPVIDVSNRTVEDVAKQIVQLAVE